MKINDMLTAIRNGSQNAEVWLYSTAYANSWDCKVECRNGGEAWQFQAEGCASPEEAVLLAFQRWSVAMNALPTLDKRLPPPTYADDEIPY